MKWQICGLAGEDGKSRGYDIISGTRYSSGSSISPSASAHGVVGWSLSRKLNSLVANFLASHLLMPWRKMTAGTAGSDLTGSFRLYRREVLADLLSQCKARGYVMQMELLVRAARAGYSIADCPIVFVDRQWGQSKLGGSEILGYLKGLLTLWLE